MWFPNRSDTNRPVQSQKRARSLKFWSLKVEEELYYPSSENKGADCWFSHGAAHIFLRQIFKQNALVNWTYTEILEV